MLKDGLPLFQCIWGAKRSKRTISKPLKMRLYNALILPIATYAAKRWTFRDEHTQSLEVFEMRFQRVMIGVTRKDRIRNVYFQEHDNSYSEKEATYWFGYVTRRPAESYAKQAYCQDFLNPRPQRRPPKRLIKEVSKDTGLLITIQSKEPRIEATDVAQAVWREQGYGES